MLQVNPRENFPIVRQLFDPSEVGTNYVRAVIRNSRTDATIATVNLTDSGGGSNRFTKTWQTPADPSGEGLWINIETTVYTDSAYTTKNSNYSIESRDILIMQRVNPILGMGGGGGADIDYKKIAKIFRTVLNDAGVLLPKGFDIDEAFQSIISQGKDISLKVAALPTSFEMKEFNPSGIIAAISETRAAVKSIKIPESKEPDWSPILEGFNAMINRLEDRASELMDRMDVIGRSSDATVKGEMKQVLAEQKSIMAFLKNIPFLMMNQAPADKANRKFPV